MDAIAGLLDGPRAREAFLLRCSMTAPWALQVRDRAPLTLVAVVRGSAWLEARGLGGDPGPGPGPGPGPHRGAGVGQVLEAGDVAVLRGPDPYALADAPGTPLQAVIHPGQRCSAPDGGAQAVMRDVGVRTWGNTPDGETELLTGTYARARAVSEDLLQALPPVVVLRAGSWRCPYLPLLLEEVGQEAPGQQAVLDRLLDLVLVSALRSWLASTTGEGDAGVRGAASGDPRVRACLRLLHERPGHPWTVASLAAEVGTSRAVLARRFTAEVGEAPMAHLARWRLAVAADLLRETDLVLEAIARRVGYGSGFALSAAFTRERGTSPSRHRAAG